MIHTTCLTHHHDRADTPTTPEKEGAGLGIPNRQRRTNGATPFFYVRARLRLPSMGGGGGEAFGLAGFLCRRYSNSAICRSPRLESGHGLTTDEGYTMTSTTTPIQSSTETITRIAGQADALGALLAVIGILPAVDYQTTLVNCSSLANDIASKLKVLIGGAV
jgi:hypothetical protein